MALAAGRGRDVNQGRADEWPAFHDVQDTALPLLSRKQVLNDTMNC